MALAHGRLKKGSALGPYKIVRLIGEGGMGEVYEARDEVLDRQVALKVVLPELSGATEIIKRFTSEGQTLAKLNHQNVVTVHTLGEDKGVHFIVMEYVDGVSLWDLLLVKTALEIDEALHYFRQLLAGVQALHESKIIHRDIKPKNIIIRKDNSVKIVDFGIAKIKGQTEREITATGAVVGSVYYLSPEVLEGEAASVQSDIWSLGINLYEMVMGYRPFQDDNREALIKKISTKEMSFSKSKGKVPEALQKIILRMCEKVPGRRYSSVSEIIQDLEAFKSGGLVRVTRPTSPPSLAVHLPKTVETPPTISEFRHASPRPILVKNQRMKWALGGTALVLLTAGLFYTMKPQKDSEPRLAKVAGDISPQFPFQEQVIWITDQNPLQVQWTGEASEDTFLEVARDPQFQDLVFESARPRSPHMVQPRNRKGFEDGRYFWRLVKRNADEIKTLIEPLAFSVVTSSPPSLTYPASQMTFSENRSINFYWQDKLSVKNYRFQISEDIGFQKIFTVQLVGETKITIEKIPAGAYFWRVRAEEGAGVSHWTEPRNFKVQRNQIQLAATQRPAEKHLEKPIEKSQIKSKEKGVGPLGLIKAAPPSLVPKKQERKPATPPKKAPKKEVSIPQPKVEPKPVIAKAPSPPTLSPVVEPVKAPPIPPKEVRLPAAVPQEKISLATPKLKLPPNGVSIVSLNGNQNPISFKWEQISGIENYRLEVSANEQFTAIVHSAVTKDNQLVVTKTLPLGKLYWRLRAEKGTSKSDWSSIYSFEISQ